jgi:hypothetical protein
MEPEPAGSKGLSEDLIRIIYDQNGQVIVSSGYTSLRLSSSRRPSFRLSQRIRVNEDSVRVGNHPAFGKEVSTATSNFE